MATDYATSQSLKRQSSFAIGCGVLTSLIPIYSNLLEGVSYTIILMNILVPHIERLTRPVPFSLKPGNGKEVLDSEEKYLKYYLSTLILAVICLVITLLLTLTNNLTKFN